MAKRSPITEMSSYGIYSGWDSKSKQLPKIKQFTLRVPAEIDIEFGYIINIKKAKGQKIQYCIEHPHITADSGEVLAPFSGEVHINSNDWDFYLGDTIWEPIDNKVGPWKMRVMLNEKVVAEKTFELYACDEGEFWKKRGF